MATGDQQSTINTPLVWRVNMRTQTCTREPIPETWLRLGGRALIARILVDEVPGTCEPLGPYNKLLFCPGLLVGHMLSACDRLSIGGKSPLTGGVKEANAGGTTGLQMVYLGIKTLIVEDMPAEPGWWVLHVSAHGVRFDKADDMAGTGVHDAAHRLIEKYGSNVALSLIGQGGEMKLHASGIQNLDKDHRPSRIAARGGLGAVMGSKGVKAIVWDASEGQKPHVVDPEGFKNAQKAYTKAVIEHPQSKVYKEYGTTAVARMAYSFGALPTRNFSSGNFELMENISGETLRALILARAKQNIPGSEATPSHACMPGCTIQSSNVVTDANGQCIVSPLEYETIALMGTNLGIGNLEHIARLNAAADDLGIDTIELGATLGVAAEAGLLQFGDWERALELINEIKRGTPLGRILGSGAGITGKVFGVDRVPVVKNQAMSGYEPRAIKGTGVTYATTPQGADHTSGLTIRDKVDHLDPKGQADLSRIKQINMAGFDSLGACIFAGFGFSLVPNVISEFINARYGWGVPVTFLQDLGRESLKLEREFNRLAGFTKADDRLPEFMTREPLPPLNPVFDVPEEDLDGVFNW
jgi:aldehyde:ferredoxin oxidoreductase